LTVDLIWIGGAASQPKWRLGAVWSAQSTAQSIHDVIAENLSGSDAAAWLFWDSAFGAPEPETILPALSRPGDLWHAGLRVGTGGSPRFLDSIVGPWLLNRNPDPAIEATSWRLSLRASLIPTEALRQMGGIHPEFRSLDGAALEMGLRCIRRGVMPRHIPGIAPAGLDYPPVRLPLDDELRLAYYHYGRGWALWALFRSVLNRDATLAAAAAACARVFRRPPPREPDPYIHPQPTPSREMIDAAVSVLIPTIDRYSYLRTLLAQLGKQTLPPLEILVIDQTPVERRETRLSDEFPDLPLKIFYLDQAGQCSSRNLGLQMARGRYILFSDDDNEIGPDLVEAHVRTLLRFGAQASCGVSTEPGAEPLPPDFRRIGASGVFSTNNSLLDKSVFYKTGLLDLAYDRGQRADADLGMRIYLSGALMTLSPEMHVLHHRAPAGGLRTHRARVVTSGSSRRSLTQRHIPSMTEIYYAKRYFSERQVKEMLWLRVLGTFLGRSRRILKAIISLAALGDTLKQIRRRYREAERVLNQPPNIPMLERPGVSSEKES